MRSRGSSQGSPSSARHARAQSPCHRSARLFPGSRAKPRAAASRPNLRTCPTSPAALLAGQGGAASPAGARRRRAPTRRRCPACDGDLKKDWNVCPHCQLALYKGICSVCGRKIDAEKHCECGLGPVVQVRETKKALCTNCGRRVPWKPGRCVRCAMDYFIVNSPTYSTAIGIGDEMENASDKTRAKLLSPRAFRRV